MNDWLVGTQNHQREFPISEEYFQESCHESIFSPDFLRVWSVLDSGKFFMRNSG